MATRDPDSPSRALSQFPGLSLRPFCVGVSLTVYLPPGPCLSPTLVSSLSFSPFSISVDLVPLRHAIGVAQAPEIPRFKTVSPYSQAMNPRPGDPSEEEVQRELEDSEGAHSQSADPATHGHALSKERP